MEIYKFDNYKYYLLSQMDHIKRVTFARALGCNPSFLSQVLNGSPHLSLEHGVKVNRVLGHTPHEGEYFMDLLQMGRAGNQELRDFFANRLRQQRKESKQITKQIFTEELRGDLKTQYYSRFIYAALHVMSSIPADNQEQQLADCLNLTLLEVSQALGFLSGAGLVRQTESGWKPTKKRIHLSAKSPEIVHHHRNFRLESMRRIELRRDQDIFYSGVFTVSAIDLERIRESVLRIISEKEKILRTSADEVPFVMNLDLFTVQ